MPDASERLVNLAMYLAAAREPVSAYDVRANVDGYAPAEEQDEAAYLRMFERDKDDLRTAGFAIETDSDDRYLLDTEATFAAEISLSAEEYAALRATAAALMDDPAFPFTSDLRFALAKVSDSPSSPSIHASAAIADECPDLQGRAVAVLTEALATAKYVSFTYTNSRELTAAHKVDPYGLFAREGRWYMVGRDRDRDEIRTYALARLSDLAPNAARPKSPDFERPEDFDVARYIRLPFQFGNDSFDAVLRFESEILWRLSSLLGSHGETTTTADGSKTWKVVASNKKRLLGWVVENGPGISIEAPPDLAKDLGEALDAVAKLHE